MVDLPAFHADAETADIDHMRGAGEERDRLPIEEDRRYHRQVEEVAGALPGVVGDQDVAILQRPGRELMQEMHIQPGHGIDVTGRTGDRLRQHAPCMSKTPAEMSPASRAAVLKAVRTRVCACSSTTERRRFQRIWISISPRVLLLHRAVLSIRIWPAALGPARKPCGTRVEVSASTITAGP